MGTSKNSIVKKAMVTGASEGIGRVLALRLAKEGYAITAVARNESRLESIVEELGEGGHDYLVADLSEEAGIQKAAQRLETHYDLLVNNAGFGVTGVFSDLPLDKFRPMLRVNIDALVTLSHAFLARARSGDALINVASALAFMPMPSVGLYSATKAFVASFSESLWYEQRARGVFVMGLCPGATETNFQSRSGGKAGEIPRAMLQTPEQVVDVAIRALRKRGTPTVISGMQNRLGVALTRVLPRHVTVKMMGSMSKVE